MSDPACSDLYTTCKRNKTFGKVSARFFKTERLVCVEKDGQKDGKVDSASDPDQEYSTRLVMLIKNIRVYTLWVGNVSAVKKTFPTP